MAYDLELDDELFGMDFLAEIERAEAIEELAFDPAKHPRHPAGTEEGGEFAPTGEHMFHVTHTKLVDKIKKKGLLMMQTSNWVRAGDRDRYGAGEIYAFEKEADAKRWAARMDWEFNRTMGSGKISIIKMKSSKGWRVDDNDPLSQASAEGKWLKREGRVPAEEIVSHEPFTAEMGRALVRRHAEDRAMLQSFAYNPDQPRAPKGTPTGGQWTGASDSEAEAALAKLKALKGGRNILIESIFGPGRVQPTDDFEDMANQVSYLHNNGPKGVFNKLAKFESVPIDSLRFGETEVKRGSLLSMIDNRIDLERSFRADPPLVVRRGKDLLLADGHHRAVVGKLFGEKMLRARVIESKDLEREVGKLLEGPDAKPS